MFFSFYKVVLRCFIFSKPKKNRSSHDFFTSPITKLYFCYKLWSYPDRRPICVWYMVNWTFFNLHCLKPGIYFVKLNKIKSIYLLQILDKTKTCLLSFYSFSCEFYLILFFRKLDVSWFQ